MDQAFKTYRARALKIDLFEDFDLTWNEHIVYSGHPLEYFAGEPIDLVTTWEIQILALGDESVVKTLESLTSRDDAERALAAVKDDLVPLSRLEFEAKYLNDLTH